MKHVKFSRWLVAAALLATGANVRAEAPTTAPVTTPATQPADVKALIHQLGDDDFHVRLEATRKLKAMGNAAKQALQEATKSQDPEIHARAEEVLAEMDRPPVDDSAVPQPVPVGGANVFVSTSSVSMGPGWRTMDINEQGRTIHIEEKPGSIYLKVVGQIDGQPATREYKAKTAAQFKQEHPAAFALYWQRVGGNRMNVGVGNVQGNVRMNIQVNGAGANVAIGPVNAAARANILHMAHLNALQVQLTVKMRDAQVPEAQQQELLGLLAKLRQAIPDANKDEKAQAADKRAFEQAGEAVRAKIAELKLGEFEHLLPAKPAPEKADPTKP